MPWMNQKGFAQHRGVSPQRINALVRKGVLILRKGKIDSEKADEILDQRLLGSSMDASPEITEERRRLTKARADAIEMQNAQRRQELLSREAVAAFVDAAIGAIRQHMLAVPPKLGPMVAVVDSPVQTDEIIEAGIHAALRDIAEGHLLDDAFTEVHRRRFGTV